MTPPVLAPIEPAFAEAVSFTLVRQAASHLDLFDEKADLLRAAARFVIMRKA